MIRKPSGSTSWRRYSVPGKIIAQLPGHAKVDTTLTATTRRFVDGSLRRARNVRQLERVAWTTRHGSSNPTCHLSVGGGEQVLAIRSPERLNQLVPDALMTPFEMVVGHEFGDGVSKVSLP